MISGFTAVYLESVVF